MKLSFDLKSVRVVIVFFRCIRWKLVVGLLESTKELAMFKFFKRKKTPSDIIDSRLGRISYDHNEWMAEVESVVGAKDTNCVVVTFKAGEDGPGKEQLLLAKCATEKIVEDWKILVTCLKEMGAPCTHTDYLDELDMVSVYIPDSGKEKNWSIQISLSNDLGESGYFIDVEEGKYILGGRVD